MDQTGVGDTFAPWQGDADNNDNGGQLPDDDNDDEVDGARSLSCPFDLSCASLSAVPQNWEIMCWG